MAELIILIVEQTPKFDFTLDFMDEKDHQKIKYLVSGLTLIDQKLLDNIQKCFETI